MQRLTAAVFTDKVVRSNATIKKPRKKEKETMKKLGLTIKGLFVPDRNVSTLQMSMTFFLTLGLILANIMVVKSVDLFGLPQLANTCSLITFPITYILSDVFSEVYGYKWSRITASWAFLGTVICSLFFALMIALPGNAAWDKQDQLVNILGSTPQIAFASVIAFWFGDFANDKIFQIMKKHSKGEKGFGFRAIASSLVGKYVDGAIFTFIGLSFLPLETKIIMVLNCPFIQVCLETLLLPVTTFVMKKVKKAESKNLEEASIVA